MSMQEKRRYDGVGEVQASMMRTTPRSWCWTMARSNSDPARVCGLETGNGEGDGYKEGEEEVVFLL